VCYDYGILLVEVDRCILSTVIVWLVVAVLQFDSAIISDHYHALVLESVGIVLLFIFRNRVFVAPFLTPRLRGGLKLIDIRRCSGLCAASYQRSYRGLFDARMGLIGIEFQATGN
jgi:hypothetical protein